MNSFGEKSLLAFVMKKGEGKSSSNNNSSLCAVDELQPF